MSREINVYRNKTLELKNVLKKELCRILYNKIDFEIGKFRSLLTYHKVEVIGPLIIRISGTHLDSNGVITIDCDIMVQSKMHGEILNCFVFEDIHKCSDCIYAHYEGDVENQNFLYSKMDLFLYENELSETGVTYTMYIDNQPKHTVIDLFKQVVII